VPLPAISVSLGSTILQPPQADLSKGDFAADMVGILLLVICYMLLLCWTSFMTKICTATSRISFVLSFMMAVGP
jgi:hypothetical protein